MWGWYLNVIIWQNRKSRLMPGSSQDILAQNNINRHHVIKISNGSKRKIFWNNYQAQPVLRYPTPRIPLFLVGWSVHHVFYPIKDMWPKWWWPTRLPTWRWTRWPTWCWTWTCRLTRSLAWWSSMWPVGLPVRCRARRAHRLLSS